MKKPYESEKVKQYTKLKGRHSVPKPPTKTQKFFKWILENWVGIVSLIVAILAYIKQ